MCTALFLILRGTAVEPSAALAAQVASAASADGLEVLEVRPNFFMIAGAGGNIGVQVGEDGVVVVDAGSAASAAAVVAAIKRITPKPIRYVIDTGPDADHVGGNEVLSKAGDQFYPGTRAAGTRQDAVRSVAAILAAEGVLRHMTVAWGIDTGAPARRISDRILSLREEVSVLERRSDRGAAPASGAHRQRCLRVLPSIGRRGRWRRARHATLSRHRHRARRQHRRRDRGTEPSESNSPWRRCPSCRARPARS